MRHQERLEAGKQQTLRFLSTQFSKWRLAVIVSIKKILEQKELFYSDLKDDLKQPDDQDGFGTVHQEISNGLVFLALSENLQYIEELFLMLKFSKDIAWFIKNIITYKAGQITKYIESFSMDKKDIAESFLIPYFSESEKWANEEIKSIYNESINRLVSYVREIKNYFIANLFFYNQYKHGLTVALRPFGKYNEEQIKERKMSPTKAYLIGYANLSIEKVFRQTDRFKKLMMVPDISSKYIRGNLVSLQKEDNLLRMVPHSGGEVDINDILEVSKMICTLYEIIRFNLYSTCQELKGDIIELYLPGDGVLKWIKIGFPFSNT